MKRSRTHRLSRREWMWWAGMCAAGSKLRGAELSGFYYRDYSKCLPDYLSALARRAYEKRNRALDRLTTAENIRERQAWTRKTLWQLIGGEPERTPLNARVTGHLERDGYTIDKVVYESRPGVFVTANLYVPKSGQGKFPGVLFQMGHSGLGKAYPPYQKCCQGLAQLGNVVLAFDPMGQGERIAYPNESGTDTRLSSVDEEHTLPGRQMLLLGDSATRYQLWDAIRSLDYLASHPQVDATKLASTGQSGGATITMLLACVDERLKATAVSSGNTENLATRLYNPPGATDDAEQDLINSGPEGFDRWDLLYPMAPRPLLIQVSAHDFFGTYSPRYLDDGREQFDRLAHVYRTLGHPEQLNWQSSPLPHGLVYELRLDIYNWFEKWLHGSDRKIENEPPVKLEEASVLRAGATGNVASDFQSLRPFDLIKKRAGAVNRDEKAADWRTQLRVVSPGSDKKLRSLAATPLPGVRVSAAEVNPAGDVWIPVWMFVPEKVDASAAALLVLDDRGRNVNVGEEGLYHRLARAGRVVCAVDLRGIGDTRPEVGRGNPAYTIPHDAEEDFAWASLILGEPLLAQRITDVLSLAAAIRNEPATAKSRIAVAARGRLTVPALFAFAAGRDFESLYLAGGMVSYQNLLETESYTQPLSNFAWKLYEETDLPLLAAQAAPRKIMLGGMHDGAGRPMPADQVRSIYRSSNVSVNESAAWDETALSQIV